MYNLRRNVFVFFLFIFEVVRKAFLQFIAKRKQEDRSFTCCLEHYTCTICLSLSDNTILQCANGHIFDGYCQKFYDIETCPMCKESLYSGEGDFIRNRALEGIARTTDLKFECPLCDEMLSLDSIPAHIEVHRFGPRPPPEDPNEDWSTFWIPPPPVKSGRF